MVNIATVQRAELLLVTATEVESEAVLAVLKAPGESIQPQFLGPGTYYRGVFAGHTSVLTRCEPGSVGREAATLVIDEAIRLFRPRAVLMVGIAFGADKHKQRLGDVIVAKMISPYEKQRIETSASGEVAIKLRGPRAEAGLVLSNRFRELSQTWSLDGAAVHQGIMLSGEKLVDNPDFKKQLLVLEPEAKGGEMEGAGLYSAATRRKVEWILVKAICDWGDGKKKDDYQKLAARNAVSLTQHVLGHSAVLSGCDPFLGEPYLLR